MTRPTLPQYFRKSEGTFVDGFQDFTKWTVTGSNKDTDSVNYKYGSYGLKLTGTDVIADRLDGAIGKFLSGKKKIGLWVYVADKTNLSSFRIFLSSVSNFAKYYSFSYSPASNYLYNGWNFIVVSKGEFTQYNGENWDDISIIRIRFSASTSSSITLSAIYAEPVLMPKIVLSFDDADQSVYSKAYPVLKNAGYRGVLYLITNNVGNTGQLTLAQLQEMYTNGWDIANHTKDHSVLTSLTDANVIDRVVGCSDWLVANGFTKSSYHMSYPTGAYNTHVIDLMKSIGIKTARTSDIRMAQYSQPHNNLSLSSKLELINTTTTANAKSAVDDIVATGGIGMIYGHKVADVPGSDTYACATSVLQYLLDYIKARNIDVITISEWYDQSAKPRKIVSR